MKKETLKTFFILTVAALYMPMTAFAIQLGVPFNDNMVLQRDIKTPVLGTSLPGATVMVSFNGQSESTSADEAGKWRVILDPMTAVKLKSVNESPG